MLYEYPQAQGGYRWNMLQRVLQATGLEPVGASDVQIDENWKTCLTFDQELSTEQKAALDALMANNPTFPPESQCRFVVADVWNQKAAIAQRIGVPYRIFYSQSTPGGEVDQVELHFDRALTPVEKAKVMRVYAELIREQVW